MGDQQAVRARFNRKAPAWSRKYRPGGPLAHRLALFSERVVALPPPPGRVLVPGCCTAGLVESLGARNTTWS